MKLSHLLVTDALHNLPEEAIYTDELIFTDYQGPFTTAINDVISNFIADLVNHPTSLPTYALMIAQLSISSGGLGFYNPSNRALTDLANNYIVSRRNVLHGIRTHRDLPLRQLDPALGELFTLESNSSSVFLQRIHSVIPNLASHACPPTIPREGCSQYFLDVLSPTSYKSRLKKVANNLHLSTLYNTFYNDNQDDIHLLPSILSPTTSYPLVGMNRSINYHRLKGPECQLMLRRKLRLNVFPHSFPCSCGKTHDAKGDHAFCCSRSHKGSAHNQIAHQIAKALGPALATATITQSDNNMETEPRLYLTSDPLSRPYDISFNPNNPNHLSHEFTTIGFDITIANATPPLPSNQNLSLSEDCITTLTANADVFLQDFERKKLNRTNNTRANPPVPGEAVIGDLLRSNRLLIPIAIDANGHIGPMFQYTLYGTIPPPIPPRKQFKPNRPNAKAMYERATSLPAPSGILLEADHHWKHTQRTQPTTRRFFGRSYMAPTPSITTIQQIGIGIAHAYSSLLLKATQNFKISDATPGFDIFNFLLPRDQIDVIPNLDVDVN